MSQISIVTVVKLLDQHLTKNNLKLLAADLSAFGLPSNQKPKSLGIVRWMLDQLKISLGRAGSSEREDEPADLTALAEAVARIEYYELAQKLLQLGNGRVQNKTSKVPQFSFDPKAVKAKVYPLPQQWHQSWKGVDGPLGLLKQLIYKNTRFINDWIKKSASQIPVIPDVVSHPDGPSNWLVYILNGSVMCEFLGILFDNQGQSSYQGLDQFLYEFQ